MWSFSDLPGLEEFFFRCELDFGYKKNLWFYFSPGVHILVYFSTFWNFWRDSRSVPVGCRYFITTVLPKHITWRIFWWVYQPRITYSTFCKIIWILVISRYFTKMTHKWGYFTKMTGISRYDQHSNHLTEVSICDKRLKYSPKYSSCYVLWVDSG